MPACTPALTLVGLRSAEAASCVGSNVVDQKLAQVLNDCKQITYGTDATSTRGAIPAFHPFRAIPIQPVINWGSCRTRPSGPLQRVHQIGREDVLRVPTPIWSSTHALAVKVRGRILAVRS